MTLSIQEDGGGDYQTLYDGFDNASTSEQINIEGEWDNADTVAAAQADCNRFRELAGKLLNENADDTMGAHDFWLTRNGHGAGFWDGDWPEEFNSIFQVDYKTMFTKVVLSPLKRIIEINNWPTRHPALQVVSDIMEL